MPNRVTRKNLGAWVLKCNPTMWDLQTYLEFGNDRIPSWSVAENYRSDLMRKGDAVVFWVSGARKGEVVFRGVWAIGTLRGKPYWLAGATEEELSETLWLDADRAQEPGLEVNTSLPLLERPIRSDVLAADPVLGNSEIFHAQQMPNPAFLTKAEFQALRRIARHWPKGEDQDEVITVTERGAGFGDAATNKKVEEAATNAVTEVLEKAGYEVADVSRRKLGWDLTVFLLSSPDQARHVEVKGVSSGTPKVLLTANELKKAESDKLWELAVVTNALTKPKVTFYARGEVSRRSKPFVWQVNLSKAPPSRKSPGVR
jgi:hypothetical protein